MSDDAKRRAAALPLCAQLHDDDRPPPRRESERAAPANERKTLQLCAQVRRVLEAHIPSTASPELGGAIIEAVEPAPDASRLRVVVSISEDATPTGVLARLGAMTGFLRTEIGAAISRKRVPTLAFTCIPRTGTAGRNAP